MLGINFPGLFHKECDLLGKDAPSISLCSQLISRLVVWSSGIKALVSLNSQMFRMSGSLKIGTGDRPFRVKLPGIRLFKRMFLYRLKDNAKRITSVIREFSPL
ncbi:hypothetical protein DL96DRAFT_1562679 [Flagelloscypha sp. PMI_526]|nr:hypothetical protein DL96DRAFT_1562679 [Flagelloscypha sp. PMI_526]